MIRQRSIFKFCSGLLAIFLMGTNICPPSHAQEALDLPAPGTMITQSPESIPVLLKGITINPDDPLMIDFIIDSGESDLNLPDLKSESERLINYFFASLTIPKDDLWVNLSPFEKNRIIPDELGRTELGRDMLAQDYMLKQLAASMLYPESEPGKKFWDRVHQRAAHVLDVSERSIETLNKVWIVPETAVVYEQGQSVYVMKSYLKVMLEKEYNAGDGGAATEELTSTEQLLRDIVIPEIEHEINYGRNFETLRQIYHSIILAKWYKETIRESFLTEEYVDQKKVAGISLNDPLIKEQVYQQYMEAYQKGVYNYIKEDYDYVTDEVIPRKYFSGGLVGAVDLSRQDLPAGPFIGERYVARVSSSPIGEGQPPQPSEFESFLNKIEHPFWSGAKANLRSIARFFEPIDPDMIDQLIGPPVSIYGKWVDGRLRRKNLEGLGVGNIDALWQNLIERKYIIQDEEGDSIQEVGMITEEFFNLAGYLDMNLSVDLADEVKKAVFEEMATSRLNFTNADSDVLPAPMYHVRVVNNTILGPGKGGIRWVTAGDLMNNREFNEALRELNELTPTLEQVKQFVEHWLTQESMALALGMTRKISPLDLPLGGAKGAAFIGKIRRSDTGIYSFEDHDDYRIPVIRSGHPFYRDNQKNMARVARQHSRDLARHNKVGLDIDIPAPDMRTGTGLTISWYEDEYLRYLIEQGEKGGIFTTDPVLYNRLKDVVQSFGDSYPIEEVPLLKQAYEYWVAGHPVPWLGVYTGKPPEFGGALGRAEATGDGVIDSIEKYFSDQKAFLEGKRIAIQGFGMVGKFAALIAAQRGAKVVAINDYGATLVKQAGWTATELDIMIQNGISPQDKFIREDQISLEGVVVHRVDRDTIKKVIIQHADIDDEKMSRLVTAIIDARNDYSGVIREILGNIRTLEAMAHAVSLAKTAELDKIAIAVMKAEADVFVSAVGDGVLNEENAQEIYAPLAVEGGNGSFTAAGEQIYLEQSTNGVKHDIIPDTVANRKGVFSSSRETEQAAGDRAFTQQENQVAGQARMFEAQERALQARQQGQQRLSFRDGENISSILNLIRHNYRNLLRDFNGNFFLIRKAMIFGNLPHKPTIDTLIKRFKAADLGSEVAAALLSYFERSREGLSSFLIRVLQDNYDAPAAEKFLNWMRDKLIGDDTGRGYINFETLMAIDQGLTPEDEAAQNGYIYGDDVQDHRNQLIESIKESEIDLEDNFKKALIESIETQTRNPGVASSAIQSTNENPGGIDLNNVPIDRQGKRNPFIVQPADLKSLHEGGLQGVRPVIINFTHVSNPGPNLLGNQ